MMSSGKSYIVETDNCIKCGKMYYPPQYQKHYLKLCVRCKSERRKIKLKEAYLKRRVKPKPKKWQIILKELQKGPKTKEELGFNIGTIKSHISYLRSIGYDIRNSAFYELVREPKDRLVDIHYGEKK